MKKDKFIDYEQHFPDNLSEHDEGMYFGACAVSLGDLIYIATESECYPGICVYDTISKEYKDCRILPRIHGDQIYDSPRPKEEHDGDSSKNSPNEEYESLLAESYSESDSDSDYV